MFDTLLAALKTNRAACIWEEWQAQRYKSVVDKMNTKEYI
jgi:hypothetical protein